MAPKPEARRSPVAALLYGAPIGFLGGLIGLGGAEFRLPVLAGVFGYAARRAVALNLAISLVTVVSALLIRGGRLSFAPLLGLLPVVVAMIAEAFLPQDVSGLLPDPLLVRVVAAAVFGLGVGLVSSLLGIAGGELIIPTLVFAFGAGIKTAGTASLLISLPTVAVGVLRHRRLGSFADLADLTQTVTPMGAGSVIGAVAGGFLVGAAPASVLKFVLGVILIVSAVRIFYR